MSKEISVDEAKKCIYSLDLSGIIAKLVYREGWLKSDAEETCIQYRDFLYLVKKYGPMEPSQDVDEFWHHHLLDSPAYWCMTHEVYGHFFHHQPHTIVKKGVSHNFENPDLISFEESMKICQKEFQKSFFSTKSRYPKIIYFIMKKLCF